MEWLAKAGDMKDPPTFEGMITEVRSMGLFVEAIAIGMKGVVKREDLPTGDWYFDSTRLRYTSRDGGEFRSGQAVALHVGKVDFARKFVDFTIAGESNRTSRREENNASSGKKKSSSSTAVKGQKNTKFSAKTPQKSDNRKSPTKAASNGAPPKASPPQRQRDETKSDRRGRRK
jgi:hypothetical protein